MTGQDIAAPDAAAVPREAGKRLLWRQALILLGALALMYVGQSQIFRDPRDMPTSTSYVLIILGLIIFFAVLDGAILRESAADCAPLAQPLRIRFRWLASSLGLATFAAWRTTTGEAFLGEYLLVWALSMVTLVIAVSPREGEPRYPNADPLTRRDYALLSALLIAALLVRGINLQTVPFVLDNDEANFAAPGGDARLQNFLVNPFQSGFQNHPYVHSVLIGLSTGVFGETVAGARAPSVIMGTLTVAAIYLLGRELNGWLTGLIAALFALGWSFHVHFSRLALNQAGDPLFGALAFYVLLRGLRRAAPADYVLSGITLGLSQLFYTTGRQIPLVMLAYLVFLWQRERPLITAQWRLILLVPLAAFVVLLPHHVHLLHSGEELVGHSYPNILLGGQLQEVIDSGQNVRDYLVRQVRDSFLALFSTGDRASWYGRSSNLMGPFGGPLLLIGAALSLFVILKRPRWSLALGWSLAAILVGGTLATDPPHYQRYVSGAPPFALLVAMGVTTVAAGFGRLLNQPVLRQRLALGVGAVLCLANLAFYTTVYVPERKYLPARQNWVANRVGTEIAAPYNAGRVIYLVTTHATGVEKNPIVDYLAKGIPYYLVAQDEDLAARLADFDAKKPYTFIISLARKADLDYLKVGIPGGEALQIDLDEDHEPGFYVYRSPGP